MIFELQNYPLIRSYEYRIPMIKKKKVIFFICLLFLIFFFFRKKTYLVNLLFFNPADDKIELTNEGFIKMMYGKRIIGKNRIMRNHDSRTKDYLVYEIKIGLVENLGLHNDLFKHKFLVAFILETNGGAHPTPSLIDIAIFHKQDGHWKIKIRNTEDLHGGDWGDFNGEIFIKEINPKMLGFFYTESILGNNNFYPLHLIGLEEKKMYKIPFKGGVLKKYNNISSGMCSLCQANFEDITNGRLRYEDAPNIKTCTNYDSFITVVPKEAGMKNSIILNYFDLPISENEDENLFCLEPFEKKVMYEYDEALKSYVKALEK